MKWTPEDIAFLREHYPTKGSAFVADALKRTTLQVIAKAGKLGVRNVSTTCRGRAYVKASGAPKPVVLHRGPAYIKGPLVFTDKTIRTVGPSPAQAWRTNTYSE